MDWTVYWFMLPVCIAIASVAMFSGISGAALLIPVFLIGFPLLDVPRLTTVEAVGTSLLLESCSTAVFTRQTAVRVNAQHGGDAWTISIGLISLDDSLGTGQRAASLTIAKECPVHLMSEVGNFVDATRQDRLSRRYGVWLMSRGFQRRSGSESLMPSRWWRRAAVRAVCATRTGLGL
jgi:hypothetical protein